MANSYIEKPYSDSAIDILLKFVEQGGKEYDIEIDEQPIVSRTDNIDYFYDFVNYISPSTQFVSFRIYKGKSRHYDRTVLLRKSNGLNGTPAESARNAYDTKPKVDIEKERSDWEKDRKIEDLTEEVAYLTNQIEVIRKKAKKKIEEAKNSNSSLSGILETFAPAAVQILANSKLSQTYPALGMLGSLNQDQDQEETTYNPPPTSEVKFSAASEPSLTEKQQKQLHFFKQLEKNFDELELVTIFDFLKRAAHDKELLENLIPNQTENEF
ncbi:hypothetical protein V9L05_01575 [Bernardetia sp. Wsw4-3y2]|uniref:hypothetical protein n=1 Tax=Bernardetia sp. Wsw4-3y2 TaxID=3127471 RepID=UPI0030CEC889